MYSLRALARKKKVRYRSILDCFFKTALWSRLIYDSVTGSERKILFFARIKELQFKMITAENPRIGLNIATC